MTNLKTINLQRCSSQADKALEWGQVVTVLKKSQHANTGEHKSENESQKGKLQEDKLLEQSRVPWQQPYY